MGKQKSEIVAPSISDLNQTFIENQQSVDKKSSDEPRLTCSEQVITSKSSLLSNLNALKDYENQLEQ